MICYNKNSDFVLAVLTDPAMPAQADGFLFRLSCGEDYLDWLSDEIELSGGLYLLPYDGGAFDATGEVIVSWTDLDGSVHPAVLAVGRAFVGEPREANDSTGQTAALKAEVDKLSQRVSDNTSAISRNASAIADHADTIDTLDTDISTLSSELAARMTGQEWLEAIDEGFRQRDVILANLERVRDKTLDHDDMQVYRVKGYDTTPLFNVAPYAMPPIEFPEPPEGKEYSMASMFCWCDKLLHVAPMKVPGISLSRTFQRTGLVKAPAFDTSAVKIFTAALMSTSIREWPEWDLHNATDLANFVQECHDLVEVPDLDMPDVTNMRQWLWNNKALRRVGVVKAPKCTDLYMTVGFQNLEYIGELDYGQLASSDYDGVDRQLRLSTRTDAPKLRYLRIINLGQSSIAEYILVAPNWGDGSEENRQSLVDTLLTCSYDRAAAGMPTATVRLHTDAVARLSPEELAAITAKGFTLTTVS